MTGTGVRSWPWEEASGDQRQSCLLGAPRYRDCMGDGAGVDGISTWWADALALEAAEQAATRTPERIAREAVRKKAQIAEYRRNCEPLPPKTRWRARKQVGAPAA